MLATRQNNGEVTDRAQRRASSGNVAVTRTLPRGEGESFDVFFSRMSRPLLTLAYFLTADRSTAEDLTQDTLVQVWRNWELVSAFDLPEAWARKVLRNLAINNWKRTRRTCVGLGGAIPPLVGGPDERRVMLAAALQNLSEGQCHAVILHDGFGMPLEEVALQLAVPVGTVKSWVHRGRASVARQMGREADDEQR